MTTEEKSTTILAYMEEEFVKAVNDMSTLGIYRKEFETLLRMYAEARAQYRLAWEESYGMEEQGNGSKLEKILGEVGKLQSGV